MTTIRNVKLLTGELISLTIENMLFQSVTDQDGQLFEVSGPELTSLKGELPSGDVDAKGQLIVPGALDVHVHSRDPGFTNKEDWHTMAACAFHGGVVGVCDMPNTMPPVMTKEAVLAKADIASQSELPFRLYLGVGKDNISQLNDILLDKSLPLSGLKVYYGQSTGSLMFDDLEALHQALPNPMPGVLVFHSEDQCCIDKNMEKMAAKLSKGMSKEAFAIHSEIRSSEAAWASTKVILDWAKRWGREIHIAHLSTPKELEMIEEYKALGVKVTSEVAPHHLVFSIDDYKDLGALIKMNPPVRTREERDSLCRYFGEGKIEYFATDHAPHTLEEKAADYEKCPSGVPGLDYFWPQLLELGNQYGLTAQQMLNMAGWDAGERFGFEGYGRIEAGFLANFVLLDETQHTIDNKDVASKCGWTPYAGMTLSHKVQGTWLKGKRVF